MNFVDSRFSESGSREEFRCRCGAQPKLIRKIMDSRNGTTVRIFECQCGQLSWTESKQ
jgi:predicted SprT family Zn-dependent metalloprotease